jgi:hypothetical protein
MLCLDREFVYCNQAVITSSFPWFCSELCTRTIDVSVVEFDDAL